MIINLYDPLLKIMLKISNDDGSNNDEIHRLLFLENIKNQETSIFKLAFITCGCPIISVILSIPISVFLNIPIILGTLTVLPIGLITGYIFGKQQIKKAINSIECYYDYRQKLIKKYYESN